MRKQIPALPGAVIYGEQMPRLVCYPDNVIGSLGQENIELAASAGLYLDPWEAWSLDNMLSLRADKKWAAFENLLIVGRQNGKGSILEARELGGLFLFKERLMIHTAHEFKTSEEAFLRIKFLIDNTDDLSKRVAKMPTAHGQEGIELLPTPTLIMGSNGKFVSRSITQRLRFLARSLSSGRGFSGDLLVYDEAMILDAVKVSATLPTLSARPNPQVIYMASAGMNTSTQLAKIRRRGEKGGSKALFFAEWSIHPHDEYCKPECTKHDDPDSVLSWAKSNPGMGYRIPVDYIAKEREALDAGPDWERERLGVGTYPAPLEGWLVIPHHWWDSTFDPEMTTNNKPTLRNVVFTVDIAPDRRRSSIGVAGLRPDGFIGFELVDSGAGIKWLIKRCVELDNSWHPIRWLIDPHAAAGSIYEDLHKQGLRIEKLQTTEVAHACGTLFDGFSEEWLRHGTEPEVKAALAAADKRPLSESWAFDRRNSAIDLSPLMAIAFAVWGYKKYGEGMDYSIRHSVHFDLDEIIRLTKAGLYGPLDLKRLKDEGLLNDSEEIEVLKTMGWSDYG